MSKEYRKPTEKELKDSGGEYTAKELYEGALKEKTDLEKDMGDKFYRDVRDEEIYVLHPFIKIDGYPEPEELSFMSRKDHSLHVFSLEELSSLEWVSINSSGEISPVRSGLFGS